MSDQAYENREAMMFHNQLREAERAPLADRKAAQEEFQEIMAKYPDRVGERVDWILQGNYGYGAMQAAKRVLRMTARANKVAALTHMVGALDHQCPARGAIAAWKKLTREQKGALDHEVKKAIAESSR